MGYGAGEREILNKGVRQERQEKSKTAPLNRRVRHPAGRLPYGFTTYLL